ncbi:formate dehydrogenase accessory sulfurtransferase FdhD [Actinocatenispora sera]
MGRMTDRRPTVRIVDDRESHRPDTLVVEEPLEIRVDASPLAVTMRTPGDDVDLAVGFLCTEGVVRNRDDVRTARHCSGNVVGEANAGNVLDVTLAPDTPVPSVDPTRNFYTTSSCGLCGKASIDAVRTRTAYPVADDDLRVSVETLAALPDRLREAQRIFDRTGGLHAAGLFAPGGAAWCVREDVGRHNAVDKVIGWALRNDRLPLRGSVLLVSGRASFELVQKASMAGIPMLAAVSAPSTLAVDLAAEVGMTLVGFLRGNRMNVYTGAERVVADHESTPSDVEVGVGRQAVGGRPPASA